MERTRCLRCGRIGYTASPERATCDHCGASLADIQVSYKVSMSAACIYRNSDGALKMKINVSVSILIDNKHIFFVSNLTFCSPNEVESFDYDGFLRTQREDLFRYKSPILTNEVAYLYIKDRRPPGGVL